MAFLLSELRSRDRYYIGYIDNIDNLNNLNDLNGIGTDAIEPMANYRNLDNSILNISVDSGTLR